MWINDLAEIYRKQGVAAGVAAKQKKL